MQLFPRLDFLMAETLLCMEEGDLARHARADVKNVCDDAKEDDNGGGEAQEPLAPDAIFHLIDTPRVPELLTLSMLGLGICVLLGKRKRHVVRKIRQIINTIESLTSF